MKTIGIAMGVLAMVVIAVILLAPTSLVVAVGRKSPAIAAALSPPAFSHEYTDGEALGFVLGAPQREVLDRLRGLDRLEVIAQCRVSSGASLATIGSATDLPSLMRDNELCAILDDDIPLHFRFDAERLESLELSFSYVEGP